MSAGAGVPASLVRALAHVSSRTREFPPSQFVGSLTPTQRADADEHIREVAFWLRQVEIVLDEISEEVPS